MLFILLNWYCWSLCLLIETVGCAPVFGTLASLRFRHAPSRGVDKGGAYLFFIPSLPPNLFSFLTNPHVSHLPFVFHYLIHLLLYSWLLLHIHNLFHSTQVVEEKRYKCGQCNIAFSSWSAYDKHVFTPSRDLELTQLFLTLIFLETITQILFSKRQILQRRPPIQGMLSLPFHVPCLLFILPAPIMILLDIFSSASPSLIPLTPCFQVNVNLNSFP